MPTGYISHYNEQKHYGFIDCQELDILELVYFHLVNCDRNYKHIYKGDEVHFDFQKSEKGEDEAVNISFIQNVSLAELKSAFEKNIVLKGFLKKIDETYYVKDLDTKIFMRLLISENEINLKENYEDKLNKIINYKIVSITDKNKIKVKYIDKTYKPECSLILEKKPVEARVMNKVKGGYIIKVYDKVSGFIPNSLVLKIKEELLEGEIISVTCIREGENYDDFIFDLTENIEIEKNKIGEKQSQLDSIKNGDVIIGEIKSCTSFGVFVSLGFIDGLVHISSMFKEYESFKDKFLSNKLLELLSSNFKAKEKIQVVVDGVQEGRISIVLDNSIQQNIELCNEINTQLKLIFDLHRKKLRRL